MQENVNLNDHENVITHFLLKEETLCTRIIMIIIFARKATEAAIATTMTITDCTLASSGVAGKEKYIATFSIMLPLLFAHWFHSL